MNQAVAETEQKYKTCLITVVEAGKSDAVIKVYPATGEAEKVWLTNRPGVERWEEIERFLNSYARRGTRVPKPAPYHASGDLSRVILKDADIPTVYLEEGQVFEPKQEEDHVPAAAPNPIQQQASEARFAQIEAVQAAQGAQLGQIQAGMNAILAALNGTQAPAPKVVAPSVEDVEALTGQVICDAPGCGKGFKNDIGLRFHKGKFHKEGK